MKQETALDILKKGYNIFLTGPAGSGKTFLLNAYIAYLKQNNISFAVTASTGIAATHIGGRTIHSWSGIGIKDQLTAREMSEMIKKPMIRNRLEKVDVLIIDEISMIHAHQFDLISDILQQVRKDQRPFGGMQVILSGDFFQLPPVRKNREESIKFVDQSRAWQEMDIKICYLSQQFRQKNDDLSKILYDIRNRCITEHTQDLLQKNDAYTLSEKDERKYTKLYTHNTDVDLINQRELSKLKKQSYLYRMISDGNEKLIDSLVNGCLAPERLVLKEGALIMFVRNNFDQGYVNGTMGTIVGFSDDRLPIIETLDGTEIHVTPEVWAIEEDGEELACIKQLPLRLAWAITIHKSQGMTLDAAEIDLRRCFEYGMGYVALSRVRSLKDMRLLGINDMALQIDPQIFEKDQVFQKMSSDMEKRMQEKAIQRKRKMSPKATVTTKKDTRVTVLRKKYPRAYKPWTEKEDRVLLSHIKKGIPIAKIAKLCGRQEDAVRSRLRKIT